VRASPDSKQRKKAPSQPSEAQLWRCCSSDGDHGESSSAFASGAGPEAEEAESAKPVPAEKAQFLEPAAEAQEAELNSSNRETDARFC
jgi:hypothetical protein